jgi:hypothetical protein
MRNFMRPRWRKPAGHLVAGAALAVAWAVHGGRYWWVWASLLVIAAAGRAFILYVWAGEDDDLGALAGSRADERQQLLSLRSRAMACNVTAVAAFIGLAVAIALRASWWWPFAVVLGVIVLSYLLSLPAYGIAEEDPAEGGRFEPQAPSTVSS